MNTWKHGLASIVVVSVAGTVMAAPPKLAEQLAPKVEAIKLSAEAERELSRQLRSELGRANSLDRDDPVLQLQQELDLSPGSLDPDDLKSNLIDNIQVLELSEPLPLDLRELKPLDLEGSLRELKSNLMLLQPNSNLLQDLEVNPATGAKSLEGQSLKEELLTPPGKKSRK